MPARRYLTANLTGSTRQVTHKGRDYLVAHASIINPGVLSGSRGALYYPPEECARNASDWDGIPLTVRHPFDPFTGQHLSARESGVWSRQGIGRVRNTTFNGKLRCEAWFDVQRTKRLDPRILNRLHSGQPLELSTGLYTSNQPAGPNANHRGVPYDHIATNYRPDHLAILPDEVGACSISDGCGVLVNKRVRNSNPEGINQYSGSRGQTKVREHLRDMEREQGIASLLAHVHTMINENIQRDFDEENPHDKPHVEALEDLAGHILKAAAKHRDLTGNRAGDDRKGSRLQGESRKGCGDGG